VDVDCFLLSNLFNNVQRCLILRTGKCMPEVARGGPYWVGSTNVLRSAFEFTVSNHGCGPELISKKVQFETTALRSAAKNQTWRF
jgi:hypothetical protein